MSGVQFTVFVTAIILSCSWRDVGVVALDDRDAAAREEEEHQFFMQAFATYGTSIESKGGLRGGEKKSGVGRKRIVPQSEDEESMSFSVPFSGSKSISLSLDDMGTDTVSLSFSFSFSFSTDASVSFDPSILFEPLTEESLSVSLPSLDFAPSLSFGESSGKFSMMESVSFSMVDTMSTDSMSFPSFQSFSFSMDEMSFDPDSVFLPQGTGESLSLSASFSFDTTPFPSFGSLSLSTSISFEPMMPPLESISLSMPDLEESMSISTIPPEASLSFFDPFPGQTEEDSLSFSGSPSGSSLSFSLDDIEELAVFEGDQTSGDLDSSEEDVDGDGDATSGGEASDIGDDIADIAVEIFTDATNSTANVTEFGDVAEDEDVAVEGTPSAEDGVIRRIRRRRLHGLTGRSKIV